MHNFVNVKATPSVLILFLIQTKMKMTTMGLEHVVDPRLEDDYPKGIYKDIIKLALDCASFKSEERPSMKVKKRKT